MGSRAVVVVCRDDAVASARFGIERRRRGIVYTRTGRPFFADGDCEAELLGAAARGDRRDRACGTSSTTDWVAARRELLPWSAKAEELLRTPVRVGRRGGDARRSAPRRGAREPRGRARGRRRRRRSRARGHGAHDVDAVRRRVPALLLAGRRASTTCARAVPGARRRGRPCCSTATHPWHMERRRASAPPRTRAAPARRATLVVDVDRRRADEPRRSPGGRTLTADGGEGMVVKPRRRSSCAARAVSCSPASSAAAASTCGSSTAPSTPRPSTSSGCASAVSAASARSRCASSRSGSKRSSGSSRGEPLYRVHECVFGVLALESEPVDPRL